MNKNRLKNTVSLFSLFLCVLLALCGCGNGKNVAGVSSDTPTSVSSEENKDTSVSSETESSSEPDYPAVGPNGLDANYSVLLLVNDANPLPDDYPYEDNLTEIPKEYINGSLNKINSDVWPYMKAMIDAQRAEESNAKNWVYVRSPYRSYATQKMLFERQINRWLDTGMSREDAETKAATRVTRPGRSEHNTGLCADFNLASEEFEDTEMFRWLSQNAEEYGFILRFPKDKQDITGITYEAWHYRFVGINTAKEMKRLGMCLEEYVEYLNSDKK